MHNIKYIVTAIMLCFAITVSAKPSTKQTVYMFGFSASFNDSTIYFTNVQPVEGYIVNDRTHFLVNRDDYSYQLRNYFDNRGQVHRTCITVYSTNKKDIDKKYEKMKAKYTTKSKNKFDVLYLTDDDFKFETVTPDEGAVDVDSEEAEKAAQKSAKERKKGKKPKDMPMGPPPEGGGLPPMP